ncbi:MAG: prolipoprotein diacylglyceryl transferase [Bacteroidetes bacterium HGW-Bacteroidetes-21]|jgi:prolipoprotein diacylglyceryl transferase|nr:MAG: prolipoprotein diacylglyceryl transferase [Bacteroidetes bacterium HGW-Bacteroidetes-21]
MTNLFITWAADPELFEIFGLSIRWYGLLFALGFVFGYLIIKRIFERENVPLKVLDSLTMYMVIGTVVGARLGHCFFYEPQYYLNHPFQILNLRQGGLASHGSAIGILVSLYLFSRKHKKSFLWTVDRIVIVVALAGALIRTGNFMNSEIVGSFSNSPVAVMFENTPAWSHQGVQRISDYNSLSPEKKGITEEFLKKNKAILPENLGFYSLSIYLNLSEDLKKIYLKKQNIPRYPSQLFEAIACLLIFGLLFFLYFKRKGGERPGYLLGLFLILIFGFRFFVEFIKDAQVDFEMSMALNMGQILSIPFVLTGIWLVYRSMSKPKLI